MREHMKIIYHTEKFDIGEATRRLKANKKVARVGWNGKGMYLFVVRPNDITDERMIDIGEDHIETWDLPQEPCLCLKTAQGTIMIGWTPNGLDLFAEDFVEVTIEHDAS